MRDSNYTVSPNPDFATDYANAPGMGPDMSWGNILGMGLGGLAQMGMKNPANAAMPYLNQIQGAISPYFNPYIQAGQSMLPQLQGQYGQLMGMLPGLQNQYGALMNDPSGMMKGMGSTFQESPGYEWQKNQMMQGVNNAAAAGGMLGTPQAQQNMASTVGNLANQDYYNYLDHLTNLYKTGLAGQTGLYGMGLQGAQGMAGMGLQAGTEMGTDLANALMSQAQLAYAGQANQNQSQGGAWGGIGSAVGGILSHFGF